MLRTIAPLLLALAACTGGEHRFHVQPLPELVMAQKPTAALDARQLLLVPGERMVWDVTAKGFTIARAELIVGANDVTSRVKTGMLASSVTSISHELVTVVDRDAARPRTAVETLEIDGDTKHIEAAFDATSYTLGDRAIPIPGVHTIHSALGVLRAWAAPEAHAGYLRVLVAGQLYRLEVNQPGVEELQGNQTLRIDCRVLPDKQQKADPITVTLWLSATEARTPVRIEIVNPSGRLTVELVERTESTVTAVAAEQHVSRDGTLRIDSTTTNDPRW